MSYFVYSYAGIIFYGMAEGLSYIHGVVCCFFVSHIVSNSLF